MRAVVGKWLPLLVAGLVGLTVLAGYLVPDIPGLLYWRGRLVEWAVIVAAFAFVAGLLNIVFVHGGRVARLDKGWVYSLVLLAGALLAWVPGILPLAAPKQKAFEYVIGPLGAGLAALMLFTLVLAAIRLMRARRSPAALLFLLVTAVVLLGSTPFIGLGWLAVVRDWIVRVPAMAGMRGLLLGVALGTVIVALRVILGADRPHSEL